MKYRIVENSLGCYPQVRKNLRWWRIGKHLTGFGLYPKKDFEHPKTMQECEKILIQYMDWITKKNIKTIYKYKIK